MQCQLTEVCQELTVLKDQFQHKTSELVDAQRELDGCQREVQSEFFLIEYMYSIISIGQKYLKLIRLNQYCHFSIKYKGR